MNYKQKVDAIVALILILIGMIITLLPTLNLVNMKIILITIFALYSIINLIQFLLTRTSKDIEGILTFIFSLVPLILSIVTNTNKPVNIAMIIMSWVILMSVAKLKKADYYHDRQDRMWKLRIFTLGIFIILGILVAINLNYNSYVQTILIGLFFVTHGILELIDPIVKTLINHA